MGMAKGSQSGSYLNKEDCEFARKGNCQYGKSQYIRGNSGMTKVKGTSATRWESSGRKGTMRDHMGSGIGSKWTTFSETE